MSFQIFTSNPDPVPTPKERVVELVRATIQQHAPKVKLADVMLVRCRHARVVAVRALVWRVMVHEWGWSLARVGRMFGCNHTTVLHAIRKEDREIYPKLTVPPRLSAEGRAHHLARLKRYLEEKKRREAMRATGQRLAA